MFGLDSKEQTAAVPMPQDQPEGIIISPDTHRANRVPPGQSRTRKWPVLDASGAPHIDMEKWQFRMAGLVGYPVSLTWDEFVKLPRVKVFSDFHCVTRWSRLGNVWEGVSVKTLIDLAGGVKEECQFVLARGYDHGWTTNMPLADFLVEDTLVAIAHDGEPITEEHGGPARLIVPRLYAWKSAKWLAGLEFLAKDQPGFWERNGYHMHGDPWTEERFGY
ncbi:MAG: sulfite oxidase-like oxidoreductase [Acidobacteria bacterium]|nr:sulfite oxidase-like oxidoreductase [Acidobacteriota bacterium]